MQLKEHIWDYNRAKEGCHYGYGVNSPPSEIRPQDCIVLSAAARQSAYLLETPLEGFQRARGSA